LVGDRRKLLDAIAALQEGRAKTIAQPLPTVDSAEEKLTGPKEAERRQLTVMFLRPRRFDRAFNSAGPRGPSRGVIGTYHKCVAETVARFDGFVAKYMGDGVLTYFGYPYAHEDDPERAVRAGLLLVDAVRHAQATEPLQVRIGIATGLVVIGDLIGSGESQERGIVGETPNLAARLKALAPPGTVVIGPRTRRLLANLFEYQVPECGFASKRPISKVCV
jgi:class 3 adenylate cyclase